MKKIKGLLSRGPSYAKLAPLEDGTRHDAAGEDTLASTKRRHMSHWEKEWILLKMNSGILALGFFFQYVHVVATNVAYYLHRPREPIKDLGHTFLPQLLWLGPVSDILFILPLITTICFAFLPCFRCWCSKTKEKSHLFSTLIIARFVAVTMFAQALRILTFLFTTMPGPNIHCRPDSADYHPPRVAVELLIPFSQSGCGDLVFSYRATLLILCALTVQKYSSNLFLKRFVWIFAVLFGFASVAARRHYSVDVVIAWYAVPLVWFAYEIYFPDKIPASINPDWVQDVSFIEFDPKLQLRNPPHRIRLSSLSQQTEIELTADDHDNFHEQAFIHDQQEEKLILLRDNDENDDGDVTPVTVELPVIIPIAETTVSNDIDFDGEEQM